MEIKKTKKGDYKLKMTYEELAIIKNTLDKHDDYSGSIDDELFDKDGFNAPFKFNNFEFSLRKKMKKELSKFNV